MDTESTEREEKGRGTLAAPANLSLQDAS